MIKRLDILLIFLFILLIVCLYLGINLGYAKIPAKDILDILLSYMHIKALPSHIRLSTVDIIVLVRLPRLILSIIVGMALALSGATMQALLKNPLADPYVLGISSGASFGVSFAVVIGINKIFGWSSIGIMAFVGAIATSFLVLFISNLGSRATSIKLILSGLAISTVASSFSSLLIYLSNNRDAARQVIFWLLGSVAGAKWNEIIIVGPLVLLCTLFFITQYRILNLMLLGDEVSLSLGVNLGKYRQLYIILISLVIGFVVYVSGVLGFVGLIIPHIARFLVGTDHKKLIPVVAILGAILVLIADIIARNIAGGIELPTGIILSVIGSPLFIYLIVKRTMKNV